MFPCLSHILRRFHSSSTTGSTLTHISLYWYIAGLCCLEVSVDCQCKSPPWVVFSVRSFKSTSNLFIYVFTQDISSLSPLPTNASYLYFCFKNSQFIFFFSRRFTFLCFFFSVNLSAPYVFFSHYLGWLSPAAPAAESWEPLFDVVFICA